MTLRQLDLVNMPMSLPKLIISRNTIHLGGKCVKHPRDIVVRFEDLPESVIAIVLSFLFSGVKTDWSQAMHDFNSVKCLNKSMRTRLGTFILPQLPIALNLVHYACPSCTFHTLIQLGKYKFKLTELHLNSGYNDFDLLATLMCAHFESTLIKSLTINLPARPVPDRYIRPHHKYNRSSRLPSLTCGIERYIEIPKEFSRMHISGFIALPIFQALTTLKTSMFLSPIAWDDSYDCIFELPLLQSLHLSLSFLSKPRTKNSPSLQTLSARIGAMQNLQQITLRVTSVDSGRYGVLFTHNFHLRSNTLRRAHFHQLPAGFFLRDCHCPKLELLTCRDSCHGNGVRPNDPSDCENIDFTAIEGDYTLGTHPFFGMVTPSECVVSFRTLVTEELSGTTRCILDAGGEGKVSVYGINQT